MSERPVVSIRLHPRVRGILDGVGTARKRSLGFLVEEMVKHMYGRKLADFEPGQGVEDGEQPNN